MGNCAIPAEACVKAEMKVGVNQACTMRSRAGQMFGHTWDERKDGEDSSGASLFEAEVGALCTP